MPERAVPRNLPQAGINCNLSNDPVELFLGDGGPLGRSDHFILPPVLDGDTANLGPENGLNIIQDVAHLVPDLVPAVDAGNGDQEAPNDRLQRTEQQDVQAVRNLLPEVPILNNAISARYCWMILKNLRRILPKEGPYQIPDSQADYVRILERLARVMIVPKEEDYESARCNLPLGYEAHCHQPPLGYEVSLQLLQQETPNDSCPWEYGECLDRLCEEMAAASAMMRFADGIYVLKDRDEYASRLLSLAARLRRPG